MTKKSDISQDWFVTTIGRGRAQEDYVINKVSEQKSLEDPTSQAKFYCDSTLEPELLSVEYSVRGIISQSEAKAHFKCAAPRTRV